MEEKEVNRGKGLGGPIRLPQPQTSGLGMHGAQRNQGTRPEQPGSIQPWRGSQKAGRVLKRCHQSPWWDLPAAPHTMLRHSGNPAFPRPWLKSQLFLLPSIFPSIRVFSNELAEIRLIISFAAKDGEALYSQQKQDQELTVAEVMATHSSTLAWRIPWTGDWQAIVHGVAKSRTLLSD